MHPSTITKVVVANTAYSLPAQDQKVVFLAVDNTVFSDFCVRWFLDNNIFADAFIYLVNVQPHFTGVDALNFPSDLDKEESIALLNKYSEILKFFERQFTALLLVSHSPKEAIVAKAMESSYCQMPILVVKPSTAELAKMEKPMTFGGNWYENTSSCASTNTAICGSRDA
ncbi:hypothetical protein HDU98_006205 [Podochytrium sp. JEL0797]|nr:hypothetical protein HDU98_006205 [Podochytrium sp. JEL0797]